MSAQYGMKSTFGASTSDLRFNIENQITKYPAPRIELLKRWDGSNFKAEVKSHKYEWSARDNRPVKADVVDLSVAADATSMIVDTAGVFNVGDLFMKPSGEQCVVTAVAGGTNITFRHLAGTAEALAAGDEIKVIGGAVPQGSKAGDMVTTGLEDLYNYTSILKDTVKLTGTQNEALIRGEEGSDKLIARKQQELMEKLQSQLVMGVRTKDDVNETYTLGGLKYFIDTYASSNVIDFGGNIWASDAAVEAKLDDAFDIIAAKSFDKPVMYVGAKWMRKFKYIQDDTTRTTMGETKRGIGVVKKYMSHLFGDIDVVLLQDRIGLLDDLVFIVDESMLGYKPMRNRGWFTYKLGLDGDRHIWEVIGEYTFKLDLPQSAVYLHNLGV